MSSKRVFILLFLVAFLKQLLWIALIPVWQTPDEQAHFAQIQNISENNKIGKYTSSLEIETSEKFLGVKRDQNGNNLFTYHPDFRIEYTNLTKGKFEDKINNIDKQNRKVLSFKEATGYPPLYYQIAAIGYKIDYSQGLIDRVFFVRIFQTLIYCLLVFIFYKMAAILLPKKNALFFLTFILFLPMPTFVFSGITSDNLMNLLFPAVILLGLLIVKNGFKTKYFLSFFFLLILGGLTKPHFIIALPVFFSAVFIKALLEKKAKLLLFFILSFVFLYLIFNFKRVLIFSRTLQFTRLFPEIGGISFRNSIAPGSMWSYLVITLQKTYRETIPWFWGVFRWLSFSLDRLYYRALNLLTILSLVSGVFWFFKKVKLKRSTFFWQVIFLTLSFLIYGFVLFFWDYLFFLSHGYSFGIQGRYYFPVLFPIAFLIFYFAGKIISTKALAVFSVFLNVYALLKIAMSYYDFSSIRSFVIQASQYKPWYFKSSYLIFWVAAYITILAIFLIKLIRDKKEY